MNNNMINFNSSARGAARPGGLRSRADECPFDLAQAAWAGRTTATARRPQIKHQQSQTPSPLASRRPLVTLALFIPTFIPLAPFIPSSEGTRTAGKHNPRKTEILIATPELEHVPTH